MHPLFPSGLPAACEWLLVSTPRGESPPTDGLPPHERARMESFGNAERRQAFALGRNAVRTLLARRLGIDLSAIPLTVAESGALEVSGSPLRVSLAHSKAEHEVVALAAAAECSVGVDVEAIRSTNPNLYRRILHPSEWVYLDGFKNHDVAHITMWALKEAVLKGRGTGLRCAPRDVRLDLDLSGRTAVAHVGPDEHWRAWLAMRPDMVFALALRTES